MDLSNFLAKPDKSIRRHTKELKDNLEKLRSLNYVRDEYIFNLTKIACEYHDYGKVNREFQNRIKNQTKFDDSKEVGHNILSIYFLNPEEFEDKDDYYRVAFAILFHHYYCDNLNALSDKKIKSLSKELLSEFKTYKIKLSTPKRIKEMHGDKVAILIKGLVNKCDFSASGGVEIEYENKFLVVSLDRLLEKWRERNRNSNWNELQRFCIENRNENIIAIAQTGMGKTEAGLHWIGDNKGFFILPLKTAINAIYQRIVDSIIDKDIEHRVALLHSDSLSYYNSNNVDEERDILTYQVESKQLSIPLNISTLDQLFDFVFKYKGYELKLVTLSYSKVVIDEIQMYSADLLAYLIYGIKEIIRFGGKVTILTATLAPFIKDLLNEDNDNKFKEGTFVNDIKRHNIKTYDSIIDSEIIYKKYRENIERTLDNKILVVCNTVKKAQEIYREFLDLGMEKENLNIFHSKFIKSERAEKEKQILEFGKTDNKGNGIWISTQIVEASLDIDFDYLFTELSDISGLFQRLGRCNRKGVKSVKDYNCFVFLDIDKNLLTNGDKGFIDRQIYYLSKEAISKVDGILSETDKINIINEYLTTEKIKGSDYWRKYQEYSTWIKSLSAYEIDKSDIKLRNIVSFNIIPKIIYEKNKDKIDEIISSLNVEKLNPIEKVNLIDSIKNFTVSVGKYDIENLGKSSVYKELEISKYNKINVMDCEYGEIGFIRNKGKKEENFDNFI